MQDMTKSQTSDARHDEVANKSESNDYALIAVVRVRPRLPLGVGSLQIGVGNLPIGVGSLHIVGGLLLGVGSLPIDFQMNLLACLPLGMCHLPIPSRFCFLLLKGLCAKPALVVVAILLLPLHCISGLLAILLLPLHCISRLLPLHCISRSLAILFDCWLLLWLL